MSQSKRVNTFLRGWNETKDHPSKRVLFSHNCQVKVKLDTKKVLGTVKTTSHSLASFWGVIKGKIDTYRLYLISIEALCTSRFDWWISQIISVRVTSQQKTSTWNRKRLTYINNIWQHEIVEVLLFKPILGEGPPVDIDIVLVKILGQMGVVKRKYIYFVKVRLQFSKEI